MAQLQFFSKLKLGAIERFGSEGETAQKARIKAKKAAEKANKPKPYAGDPNQKSFMGKLERSIKSKTLKAKKQQIAKNRAAKELKKKLNNPFHTDGRVSVLPANSNSIKQPRLDKGGVSNAITEFAPKVHLESGNGVSGKGFYKRTFARAAELSAKTQAASAKNILKRAKRMKRISARTVAVASVGSIVAAGINSKVNAAKVPKGYKMVFGKLRKVN